jgi:hypothetical protein
MPLVESGHKKKPGHQRPGEFFSLRLAPEGAPPIYESMSPGASGASSGAGCSNLNIRCCCSSMALVHSTISPARSRGSRSRASASRRHGHDTGWFVPPWVWPTECGLDSWYFDCRSSVAAAAGRGARQGDEHRHHALGRESGAKKARPRKRSRAKWSDRLLAAEG